jgi:hypothetical protein
MDYKCLKSCQWHGAHSGTEFTNWYKRWDGGLNWTNGTKKFIYWNGSDTIYWEPELLRCRKCGDRLAIWGPDEQHFNLMEAKFRNSLEPHRYRGIRVVKKLLGR